MFSKNIRLKSFLKKKIKINIKKLLKDFLNENNEIIKSLSPEYKDGYKFNTKKRWRIDRFRWPG